MAPGAERERGLKTDKGEGLQGFATIYSCYSNHLCNVMWAAKCDAAQKEGPSIITLSHRGNVCNTGFDDMGLGFAAGQTWKLSAFTKEKTACTCIVLCCSAGRCEAWILWFSCRGTVLRQHSLVN